MNGSLLPTADKPSTSWRTLMDVAVLSLVLIKVECRLEGGEQKTGVRSYVLSTRDRSEAFSSGDLAHVSPDRRAV